MAAILARPRRTKAVRPFGPRDAGIPMTLDEFDAADFKPGFLLVIARLFAITDRYKPRRTS